MSKRSYHQYCPLAYSLDIVGERWTLLIVRELLFGPRRYTDLLNGLPGIGTNLLAKRLKDMEQHDLVQQRTLPPPASSTVYELTARGHALENALGALVDWGTAYVNVPPPDEDFMGTIPAMHAFTILFDPAAADGSDLTCEVRAGLEVFHVAVHDHALNVWPGPADQPDMIVRGDVKTIIHHLMNPAADGADFSIEAGDTALFERFASAFRLPVS